MFSEAVEILALSASCEPMAFPAQDQAHHKAQFRKRKAFPEIPLEHFLAYRRTCDTYGAYFPEPVTQRAR